jgi:hypothetical protein
MRPYKKYVLIFAALLLLGGSVSFFLQHTILTSSDTGKHDADMSSSSAKNTNVPVLRLEAARMNEPLPDSELNLASIYGELKTRADAGNSKAACRLGVQLVRCFYNKEFDERLKRNAAAENLRRGGDVQDIPDIDMLDLQAEFKSAHLNANRVCKGLDKRQLDERMQYLRQAAYAGVPEAMINYANGVGFGEGNIPMRGQAFDLWRAEAKVIADRALRMGLPDAVLMYESAYYDDIGIFHALIPDDPVKSETYRQLWLRMGNTPYSQSNKKISEKDFRDAVSNAERMFIDYFSKNTSDENAKYFSHEALSYPGGFENPMCDH